MRSCSSTGGIAGVAIASLIAVAFLSAPQAAQAQAKVPRIGILSWWPPNQQIVEDFREAFRGVGHVEGQNVVIEYRWAEERADRAAALAAELVQLSVDVLVANATPAIKPVQDATRTIPIVVLAADPVGTGHIPSLARPGGNTTGVSTIGVALSGKRLELIREILPRIARVAFLASSVDPNGPRFVEQTRGAGQTLGIHVQPVFVRGAEDFDAAFSSLLRARSEALFVQPILNEQRRRIVDFATRHRLPTMSDQKTFAEAGGLIALGASRTELFQRVAVQVDKILKGAKPADLPVEEPTRFHLVVNLKTAKALGLKIPPSVLLRADQVIE